MTDHTTSLHKRLQLKWKCVVLTGWDYSWSESVWYWLQLRLQLKWKCMVLTAVEIAAEVKVYGTDCGWDYSWSESVWYWLRLRLQLKWKCMVLTAVEITAEMKVCGTDCGWDYSWSESVWYWLRLRLQLKWKCMVLTAVEITAEVKVYGTDCGWDYSWSESAWCWWFWRLQWKSIFLTVSGLDYCWSDSYGFGVVDITAKVTVDDWWWFNCLQAKLMPSDDIVVYYQASAELGRIIEQFSDFIFATIKQPLKPYPVAPGENVIIADSMPVSICWACVVRKRTLVMGRSLYSS